MGNFYFAVSLLTSWFCFVTSLIFATTRCQRAISGFFTVVTTAIITVILLEE